MKRMRKKEQPKKIWTNALANRASIKYFLSISLISHIFLCVWKVWVPSRIEMRQHADDVQKKWIWEKETDGKNVVGTHQLNTNFILWIWFSKLNTPQPPAMSQEWSEPLWMNEIKKNHPPCSILWIEQPLANPIHKIWRMLMLNGEQQQRNIYIIYLVICENVYFTCICHFYHFAFRFSCLFSHVLHQRARIYNMHIFR